MKIGQIYDEREEEREAAYNEGYQQGKSDAIEKIVRIAKEEIDFESDAELERFLLFAKHI